MLQYSDGELNMEQVHLVEKELSKDISLRREYVLNQDIDECMRVFMLDKVNSDSDLLVTETNAKNDIAEYFIDKTNTNASNSFYINGAISEYKLLEEQVDKAEREKYQYNIEHETNNWVSNWVDQKEKLLKDDQSAQKLLDFVKKGMLADNLIELEPVSARSIKKLLYRIVSVAAVLVISLSLWVLFSSKPTTEGLFAEYYHPYQIIDGQTRSVGENVDQLFKDAVKSYKNKDFNESSIAFGKLLEIDNSSVKMSFYIVLPKSSYKTTKKRFQVLTILLSLTEILLLKQNGIFQCVISKPGMLKKQKFYL
ncbi:MAG: hypothetical protein HC831_11555 [Chloroflexia bacterium]|nr:hypothetical protein [Chloroflexia bacterium]